MIPVIVVIATFDMSPADRAEFVTQRAGQTERSLSEQGCLEYTLNLDAFDPGRVRLLERWVDADALAAHVQAIQDRGGPPATIEVLRRDVIVFEGDIRSSR